MTTLVFHLGDRKAGSTSIQQALAQKRWTCAAVNLTYPHGGKLSHIGLARSLTAPIDQRRAAEAMQDILRQIESNPSDVAVVSAEDFEDVDPKVLKAALQTHMPGLLAQARFIAYVRPHADRLPSTYAERMKSGHFMGTMEAQLRRLAEQGSFIYMPRFQAWRQVFGPAFELRPMMRDLLYRRDVVADFLKFALGTEDFTMKDGPDANEALSVENLAVVRQLQMRLKGDAARPYAYQAAIGRSLARRMNATEFAAGTKLSIHRDLAEAVRKQYAADAAALDAAFFQGTPMTDALNGAAAKAVEVAQSMRIEDHFSAREQYLINLWVDQTAALLTTNPERSAVILRAEHRNAVIADDTPVAKPAPKSKPSGAAKAGRAAKRPGAGRAKGPAQG